MKHRIPEAVLPSHGAGVGPFAPRGAPKTPAPAVVYLACFGCAVFLVLCVVSEHHGARETELDVRGAGGGRRLTQWLAPVWYSLPTLFDSLYNLVRPRAPSSPPSRPRALTVPFLDSFRTASFSFAYYKNENAPGAGPGPTSSSCRRSTASPRRPTRARQCFARPKESARTRSRRNRLPRTPPSPAPRGPSDTFHARSTAPAGCEPFPGVSRRGADDETLMTDDWMTDACAHRDADAMPTR